MAQSREEARPPLAELIRVLVIAWRSLMAYPPGHPALVAALRRAHRRLREHLVAHGPLVAGVTPKGLLVGETMVSTPHGRRLAGALHERSVAILRIEPRARAPELEALFRLLAGDPREDDKTFFGDRLVAAGVTHISAQPVDYSTLRVTDEVHAPTSTAVREAVWDRLVRALLTRSEFAEEMENLVRALSPKAVSDTDTASLIAESSQLAEAVESRLGAARGPARALAARQVAGLVRELPPAMREIVLRAALRALVSNEEAAEALHALSSPFAPDVVLKSLGELQAAGTALSGHAMNLAQTLAALAEGLQVADPEAPADKSELVDLYRREDIDRYNPEHHQALLGRLSIQTPELGHLSGGTFADLGNRVDSLADDVLAEQLAAALLEMLPQHGSRPGFHALLTRLEEIFSLFLMQGRFDAASEIARTLGDLTGDRRLPREVHAALRNMRGRTASPDMLAALVAALAPPWEESIAAAARVVRPLGPTAVTNLLFLLVEETNRARRRRLFDLLVSLGPAVVDDAVRWLSDSRWYVVRNMIVLLRAVEDRSSLPAIRLCAAHPDRRVRLEAWKSLIELDTYVSRHILEQAVNDPNRRVAEVAIGLVGKYGSVEAVGPLVGLLAGSDLLGRRRAIRIRALRALGELGYPAALPHLRRFFRNWSFPPLAREERRAAFESLRSYHEEARRPIVRAGLRSSDPVIREICRRVAELS